MDSLKATQVYMDLASDTRDVCTLLSNSLGDVLTDMLNLVYRSAARRRERCGRHCIRHVLQQGGHRWAWRAEESMGSYSTVTRRLAPSCWEFCSLFLPRRLRNTRLSLRSGNVTSATTTSFTIPSLRSRIDVTRRESGGLLWCWVHPWLLLLKCLRMIRGILCFPLSK